MTAKLVKDKPILFSGPMVRAILEGRKTQTRRVVKPQPEPRGSLFAWGVNLSGLSSDANMRLHAPAYCPYGKPGTRLWVREAFCPATWGSYEPRKAIPKSNTEALIQFRADFRNGSSDDYDGRWKPSIHMPRWASRLTLEITEVRVERVQDISEEDAIAEGSYLDRCPCMPRSDDRGLMASFQLQHCHIHGEEFHHLWDSINSKREDGKYAWAKNPWCWAITFRRADA
jgi:hypothetical protein